MAKASAPSLSIVIPCFNEVEAIAPMAREIAALKRSAHTLKWLGPIEVLVVDDASTDGSYAVAKRQRVWRVLRHRNNLGYGAALKSGFAAAKGDLLAFIDMDVTYHPADFLDLVHALQRQRLDVVFGRRPRGSVADMPLVRQMGNSLFAGLSRLAFGPLLSDVCTGMRVLRGKTTRAVALETPETGLDYSMALTANLLCAGLKVGEIPIRYRERTGASKLQVARDGMRFLKALSQRAYERNIRRHFPFA